MTDWSILFHPSLIAWSPENWTVRSLREIGETPGSMQSSGQGESWSRASLESIAWIINQLMPQLLCLHEARNENCKAWIQRTRPDVPIFHIRARWVDTLLSAPWEQCNSVSICIANSRESCVYKPKTKTLQIVIISISQMTSGIFFSPKLKGNWT